MPPPLRPLQLFSWQCIGKSEAELGEIVEKAVEGSGLLTGYRFHRPFVEVKIWCPIDELEKKKPYINQLERMIQPWLLNREGKDSVTDFFQLLKLTRGATKIIDAATQGLLAQRLGSFLRAHPSLQPSGPFSLVTEWQEGEDSSQFVRQTLSNEGKKKEAVFVLSGFGPENESVMGLSINDRSATRMIPSPYKNSRLRERAQEFLLEIALKQWSEEMRLILPPQS